ncbi:MAG: DUF3617 domain-containing protein [Xanthobacteraceae bacterium]
MKAVGCWGRAGMVAGILAVSGPFAVQADGLKAGLWAVRQSPVINDMTGPIQQNLRCLTAEAVADLDKTFSPVSRTTNSACEQVEHESTPQRLKWRMQCTGQLDMDVAGEFLFENPQRYTATVTTEATMAGQLMQKSRVTIEAEWIGECR